MNTTTGVQDRWHKSRSATRIPEYAWIQACATVWTWLVAMDVSGQPTNRLLRNVCNYLRNIPEEWTSHRHHAVSWRISLHFGHTCCLYAEDRIMIRLRWIRKNQVPLRRWHLSATTRGVATHGTVSHSHRCPRTKNPCEASLCRNTNFVIGDTPSKGH